MNLTAGLASWAIDGEEPAIERPGPLELRAIDYIRFRQDVANIQSMSFDSAETTREALHRLSAHDSWALSSGWMAYAALIVADSPAFSESLRKELRGENDEPEKKKKKKRRKKKKKKTKPLSEAELAEARNRFLAKLSANPRYPRQLNGAQEAIAKVMAIAKNDHLRMNSLGENFKTEAYAMQKTRWGKKRLSSSAARLDAAESYATNRPGVALPVFDTTKIEGIKKPGITASTWIEWTPEWGYESSSSIRSADGSTVIMDRILNLAARYAVGPLNNKVVSSYAKNKKSEQCLSIVRLTLNQCIAATRTPYEEAFCLGEHAINDVSNCINWVAQ